VHRAIIRQSKTLIRENSEFWGTTVGSLTTSATKADQRLARGEAANCGLRNANGSPTIS